MRQDGGTLLSLPSSTSAPDSKHPCMHEARQGKQRATQKTHEHHHIQGLRRVPLHIRSKSRMHRPTREVEVLFLTSNLKPNEESSRFAPPQQPISIRQRLTSPKKLQCVFRKLSSDLSFVDRTSSHPLPPTCELRRPFVDHSVPLSRKSGFCVSHGADGALCVCAHEESRRPRSSQAHRE